MKLTAMDISLWWHSELYPIGPCFCCVSMCFWIAFMVYCYQTQTTLVFDQFIPGHASIYFYSQVLPLSGNLRLKSWFLFSQGSNMLVWLIWWIAFTVKKPFIFCQNRSPSWSSIWSKWHIHTLHPLTILGQHNFGFRSVSRFHGNCGGVGISISHFTKI